MTDRFDVPSRLDRYHFYEKEWESYEQLHDQFEWQIPDQINIAHYVCDRHAQHNDGAAIFYEDTRGRQGTFTFGDLRNHSNSLAHHLEDVGVKKGDRVAICVPQKPETALSHIGIWKCGAASIPLSVLFGPEALQYRLEDSETRVLVVEKTNLENVREIKDDLDHLEQVIVVGETELESDEINFWEAVEAQPTDYEPVTTGPDDLALIAYTSGTTGPPKGVCHGHRVILGHLPGYICLFCNADPQPDDVFWHVADWVWMGALLDLVMPTLYYGKPVLAYESHGGFDPNKVFELIDQYQLSNLYIPPTALRIMMNKVDNPKEQYDLSSPRILGSGGESLGKVLPEWVNDVLGCIVHEGFGQTEGHPLTGNCQKYFEYHRNIGKAMPGVEATILDPNSGYEPQDTGEIGEIAVADNGNPAIFQEYLGLPDKTKQKFKGDWMLTGDLGKQDEDGYFDFVSRKDDVIISAGHRFGPEEIEDILSKHEAVSASAVIGIPDEVRGEIPKAFIVLSPDAEADDDLVEEIQDFVRDRLSKDQYPREIEFIDELPKTSTGKIRRKTLRDRELD